MLIPQFTLRWLLLVTTVLAVAFLVISLALGGSGWAIAVSCMLAVVAVAMLTYAGLFFVVWLFSLLPLPWKRDSDGR